MKNEKETIKETIKRLHETFQDAMNDTMNDTMSESIMEFEYNDDSRQDKAIDAFINGVLNISRTTELKDVCKALLELNPKYDDFAIGLSSETYQNYAFPIGYQNYDFIGLSSEEYQSESEKNNILKKLLFAQVAMNIFNSDLKPLTEEQKKVIKNIRIALCLKKKNNPNLYKSLSDDCIRAQINLQPTEIQDIHSYINEKNSKALEDKMNEIIKKVELENSKTPEEKIQDAYNQTFTTQDPLQAFGKELFRGKWDNINKDEDTKKIVERAFKILQEAYPDGNIADNLQKLKNDKDSEFLQKAYPDGNIPPNLQKLKNDEDFKCFVLLKINLAYGDNNNNLESFGEELFSRKQWENLSNGDKDIVKQGLEVLQDKYPDGRIDDNFEKVKENQKFKDLLKMCAIVLTLGLAALSEKTTLQSTKKENFSKFQEFVGRTKAVREFKELVTEQTNNPTKSQPR